MGSLDGGSNFVPTILSAGESNPWCTVLEGLNMGATVTFEHFRVSIPQYQKGLKRIAMVTHLHAQRTLPKEVSEKYCNLSTFRIKPLEFLIVSCGHRPTHTNLDWPG
jgi:hypothetical protein